MITSTFTRLKDGAWGVRMTGLQNHRQYQPGDMAVVEVTRQDGETTMVMVRVDWIGLDRGGDGYAVQGSVVPERGAVTNS